MNSNYFFSPKLAKVRKKKKKKLHASYVVRNENNNQLSKSQEIKTIFLKKNKA